MSCVTWYAQLLSSCLHFLALFCLFIICQEEVPNFPTVNLISDCSFKSCATHLRSLLIRTSVSVILSLDFVLSNLLLVSATHLFPNFGSIPFFPNPRTTLPFPSSLRRFLTLQALSCPPCLNSMKFLLLQLLSPTLILQISLLLNPFRVFAISPIELNALGERGGTTDTTEIRFTSNIK